MEHDDSSGTATRNKQYDTIDYDFLGSKDDVAESRTVASRFRIRQKIQDDVEAFLNQGGRINEINPNVTADPPRRPVSNYGGRAI